MMTTTTDEKKFQLSPEQVEEFFERGWITLTNLFSPVEMARARECFERLVIEAEKIKTTQTHKGSHFVLSEKNSRTIIQRIVWCGAAEPYLLQLTEQQKILRPVSQLLESKEMEQLLCQAHFKLPGDGVVFDWHQDYQHRYKGEGTWRDVNGKGSYVQSLVLIDDMTLENGPVYFIPGSYKNGPIDLGGDGYDTPTSKNLIKQYIDESKAIPVTGKAGTVVLFGPYTLHGSFANMSQFPRRVLISGYAYPGANSRVYPGEGSGRKLRAQV